MFASFIMNRKEPYTYTLDLAEPKVTTFISTHLLILK